MRTAAIVNLKGGVGKSTTAINLALIMATVYRYRVLLVDNDIQANVSKFFGVHSYDYKSMENVLRDTDTMAEDVIRSSGRVGLDIIPANMIWTRQRRPYVRPGSESDCKIEGCIRPGGRTVRLLFN